MNDTLKLTKEVLKKMLLYNDQGIIVTEKEMIVNTDIVSPDNYTGSHIDTHDISDIFHVGWAVIIVMKHRIMIYNVRTKKSKYVLCKKISHVGILGNYVYITFVNYNEFNRRAIINEYFPDEHAKSGVSIIISGYKCEGNTCVPLSRHVSKMRPFKGYYDILVKCLE